MRRGIHTSVACSLLVAGWLASGPVRAAEREVEVETVISTGDTDAGSVVLLRTKEQRPVFIPIWIGESEALAIRLRLIRHTPPRPLTMDLLEKVLQHSRSEVLGIHIDDLQGGVYLGRISLRQGGRVVDLDARPSDAIALALGARVPIMIDEKVIERAALTPEQLRGEGAPEKEVPEDLGQSL